MTKKYTKLFDLSGKVAVVTGASRGIGASVAEALAEFGASVVVSSRSKDAVDEIANRIKKTDIMHWHVNVTWEKKSI